MCEPTTIALAAMAISTVSAGVSSYSQKQQADYQKEVAEVQATNERNEAREKGEEELGQRVRASREARARARVAAGESGAMGASFAAQMNQNLADRNMDSALVQKNVAFNHRATNDRLDNALSSIRSPSALEAGLSIAGTAVQGYGNVQSVKARQVKAPQKKG